MPKLKHPVWKRFECITKENNSGKWAKCRKCRIEMQGIPVRMLKHVQLCNGAMEESATESETTNINKCQASTSKRGDEDAPPLAKKIKSSDLVITKDADAIITSQSYGEKITMQIGRYFYATNTPFKHADHKDFKAMCNLIRPGYKPPSAFQIGGSVLDSVYSNIMEECKEKLQEETVSMSLDGWSNVRNEPIVCCSVVTQYGESILVDTVDTSGNSHTAEYLKNIADKAIKQTEEKFNVKVRSFVTDNTGNVTKMRRELATDLNLLAEDMKIVGIIEHILKVVKYFRNKHLPSALYKQAGGKKLVLPQEVRWNTMSDCIRTYLENRGILVQLCQDHKDDFDQDICQIINNSHIVANAKDFLARLLPVSVAVDRMQRNTTTIAVAVEIWAQLEKALKDQPLQIRKLFYKRRNMALGPIHFLANMIDHRFFGERLTNEQKEQAYNYLGNINTTFIPFVMALTSKSKPFPNFLFGLCFRKTAPLIWWKSVTINESDWPSKNRFFQLCNQLLTAVASTASIERCFSSFGLVHSKLRNNLGTEKASKLVFMLRYLNSEPPSHKKHDTEWIWESDIIEEKVTEIAELDSDDEPLSQLIT